VQAAGARDVVRFVDFRASAACASPQTPRPLRLLVAGD
jgi:hypothetical protein